MAEKKDAQESAEVAEQISSMTFREGMAKLDEIVSSLESGSLELEESLEKYAMGVQLLSELQKRLADAEQKVDVLMGELAAAPDDDVRDTTLQKA